MNLINASLVSALFFLSCLTGCEQKSHKETTSTAPLTAEQKAIASDRITMQGATLRRNGTPIGQGSIGIGTGREFFVTARSLFAVEGYYDVTFTLDETTEIQRNILRLDNNTLNESCVCIFGSKTKLPGQAPSGTFGSIINHFRFNLPITQIYPQTIHQRKNLVGGAVYQTLSQWEGFPQPVECINAFVNSELIGSGLSSTEPHFWVAFAMCPEQLAETIRSAKGLESSTQFTFICGIEMNAIHRQYDEMVKK